jgi:PKD repeat protein
VVTSFSLYLEANGESGTPSEPVALGTSVAASVAFTDADKADAHSVTWDWGDGHPDLSDKDGEGLVDVAGAGTATASHTYAEPGLYTVVATVKDGCLSTIVANRLIVVYDPAAGFVTGGGWIDSPAGAYPAVPTLAGRANFGFVSKYLKGATTPIGQTEFQFQTGKLNFHSESYDWLVVGGARAQFKGIGTINGAGEYKFLLTAVDGKLLAGGKASDRFRIKIWHSEGGSDVADYDNDPSSSNDGTVLGGGSIVIHK